MRFTLILLAAFSAWPHTAVAQEASSRYWIIISREHRRLWLTNGADVRFEAAIAVGSGKNFCHNGECFLFETPGGRRNVLRKVKDPVWVPPNWHYYEKAKHKQMQVVALERGKPYPLSDGSHLEVIGNQVVWVRGSDATPWPRGYEIILDNTVFIPPYGTLQRSIERGLGPWGLYIGDGYWIHGTHEYNANSIGQAVSHGCVRMRNADIARLYQLVAVGTPVYVY